MKDKTKLSEIFKAFVFYQQELVNTQVFAYGLMLLVLKNLVFLTRATELKTKRKRTKKFFAVKACNCKSNTLPRELSTFLKL